MQTRAPSPLRELATRLGREESLGAAHAAVLRAAQALRPVVESGAVLAACSDEFNGELRAAFEREVARRLPATEVAVTRRVFAVSNMGGRIEPGAIALANLHFTARSSRAGEKLLLLEIASHVGRREPKGGATAWGELDRFGVHSPCCGALRLLLDVPGSAGAVRFPWFDQLSAFFGPERLAALRSDPSPHAMVRAAVVHAVLQSETAIVDLLREPPSTPTHVLMVALVVVNRAGRDNAILVGLHHLRFASGEAVSLEGTALRSTPGELLIDDSRSQLAVSARPAEDGGAAPAAAPHARPRSPAEARARALEPSVRALVARHRRHVALLRGEPRAMQVYARLALRALVQELSVVAPEVALATLALEKGRAVLRAAPLDELASRPPSRAEAQHALHDFEPKLQQLGHREAREVLESLLSEHHPLLGADHGSR
jgi:hypothetical protein